MDSIAELLRQHRRIPGDDDIPGHSSYHPEECSCGKWNDSLGSEPDNYEDHVAALILALFTEEWCDDIAGPQWARYQRFVSEPVVHYGPRYFMSAVEDTE